MDLGVEDLGMGQVAGRKRRKARQRLPAGTGHLSLFLGSSQPRDILVRCPWMREEEVGGRRSGSSRASDLHFVLGPVDFRGGEKGRRDENMRDQESEG